MDKFASIVIVILTHDDASEDKLPCIEKKAMRVTEKEMCGDLLTTASTLNLTQHITPVENLFWSTHICWDFCAGKGHSFLQIMLTDRLLQAAHEDNILS